VKIFVPKHFLMFCCVLSAPLTIHWEHPANAQPVQSPPVAIVRDPRTVRLHQYLSRLHCPVRDLAEEFIHAADDNNLDWRLLPGIAVIESGGGKAYKNNNIMGWDNGDWVFPTVRAGIHHVGFRLGKSWLYRNRSTEEKLKLYNPDEAYPTRVEDVMYQISPVVELQNRAPLTAERRSNLALLARN
jgi:hypothetical protein